MRSAFSLLTLAAALVSAAPSTVPAGTKIPDNYLVVFKSNVPKATIEAHKAEIASYHEMGAIQRRKALKGVKKSWTIGNFKGYAGEFDSTTLKKIQSDPSVAYIEQEQIFKTVTVQEQATWGLNRISHLKAPGKDDRAPYDYDENTAGKGVTVYVIDTGCNVNHNEFEGRAKWGNNFADNTTADGNGHGTHCSGTIGGKTYGVAKKANIVCVKVLDSSGSGTTSGVISGVDWAAKDASGKPAVGSMSLGGGNSAALNSAVENAVKGGMTFAVAAGNDGADAGDTSPANANGVITVGAIGSNDAKTSWSNYGKVLEIWAPGLNILSAWKGSNDAVNTISGTSMATPHVAGAAAVILSANPKFTPKQVLDEMLNTAIKCAVTGITDKDSPNVLLYNGRGGKAPAGNCGTTPVPDPDPTPTPTPTPDPGEPDDFWGCWENCMENGGNMWDCLGQCLGAGWPFDFSDYSKLQKYEKSHN